MSTGSAVEVANALALREVAELEYRSLINAAAQFRMANQSDRLYRWLGFTTAILTALATGSVTDAVTALASDLRHQNAITAVLVISLGVASAALNFLDPKGDRDNALAAGRRLNALRDNLRLFRVGLPDTTLSATQIDERVKAFQARYQEIENTMLPIPDKVHSSSKDALKTNVFYQELRMITGRTGSQSSIDLVTGSAVSISGSATSPPAPRAG